MLRVARNDSKRSCHCEERSDEAISIGLVADTMIAVILAAVIGYLLGSIPFGLLLTRLAGLGDIRQIGSGSIGATNVLRTGNKAVAALTLLFDVVKGSAAALIRCGW